MGCSGNSKEMPGWTTRLANLTKAVTRWGLSGFPTVTDDTYRQRLDQCHGCELLVDDTKCSHKACGCFVARKASLATEACPLGKWMAETENVVPPQPKPVKAVPSAKPREPKITADPATCRHLPMRHTTYDAASGTVTLRVRCEKCGSPYLIDGQETITHSVAIASTASPSSS